MEPITGHVGDPNPLCAVEDALNLRGFDEIILSTLPWRISRWLHVDLPRKIAALGVPVLHVKQSPVAPRERELDGYDLLRSPACRYQQPERGDHARLQPL